MRIENDTYMLDINPVERKDDKGQPMVCVELNRRDEVCSHCCWRLIASNVWNLEELRRFAREVRTACDVLEGK